jgi:hypothetical protein
MPMFIDPTDRVAVYEFDPAEVISDQPPNIIFIRPKMDYATTKKVGTAGFKLGSASKEHELDIAENLIAMLTYNIVGWSGPDFDSVACTPENIRRLDPDQPIVEKTLDEITRRNTKASPNPKSAGINGSTSAGDTDSSTPQESVSLQLATTPSRSPLQSAIIGRPRKSED